MSNAVHIKDELKSVFLLGSAICLQTVALVHLLTVSRESLYYSLFFKSLWAVCCAVLFVLFIFNCSVMFILALSESKCAYRKTANVSGVLTLIFIGCLAIVYLAVYTAQAALVLFFLDCLVG